MRLKSAFAPIVGVLLPGFMGCSQPQPLPEPYLEAMNCMVMSGMLTDYYNLNVWPVAFRDFTDGIRKGAADDVLAKGKALAFSSEQIAQHAKLVQNALIKDGRYSPDETFALVHNHCAGYTTLDAKWAVDKFLKPDAIAPAVT